MQSSESVCLGPYSFDFELSNGQLRNLRFAGEEIVRGIYGAIRDKTWHTVHPKLELLRWEIEGKFPEIEFLVHCEEADVDYQWYGKIALEGDTLVYRFEGKSLSRFLRNRIGLCLLHPSELAGRECCIEHIDGSIERGHFPWDIAPHQPFKGIKSFGHSLKNGEECYVTFHGETFEMEDQRNWTDASFKTYGTPLDQPFPVTVQKGEVVSQQIRISCSGINEKRFGNTPKSFAHKAIEVRLESTAKEKPIPSIGTVLNWDKNLDNAEAWKLLQEIKVGHYRIEIDCQLLLEESRWMELCEYCLDQQTQVELALYNYHPNVSGLDDIIFWIQKLIGDKLLLQVLLYDSPSKVTSEMAIESFRELLKKQAINISIGCGTNANFTELNRERPDYLRESDLLTFALNPQVHAFDDRSLMETLGMQKLAANCAQKLNPTTKLSIGPITLKPRFNMHSVTDGKIDLSLASVLASDLRMRKPIGVAWFLGSLKYLMESPVDFVTYFTCFGESGFFQTTEWNPLVEVLKEFLAFRAEAIIPVMTDSPYQATAMLLRKGDHFRLTLINLSPTEVMLNLRFPEHLSFGSSVDNCLEAYSWKTLDKKIL